MEHPVTERLFLGRITPGMDVCDVTGDKIGSISHLHRQNSVGEASGEGPTTAIHPTDEIMEIKTGFLGMGKHLYIPVSEVQEVLTDSVFLSKARASFEELGYENKPDGLAELA
jgi:hypothetical protein